MNRLDAFNARMIVKVRRHISAPTATLIMVLVFGTLLYFGTVR